MSSLFNMSLEYNVIHDYDEGNGFHREYISNGTDNRSFESLIVAMTALRPDWLCAEMAP
jgi:hypothetical protein